MLQAERISYRYGAGAPLLENLNCHVHPGEVVGLSGPSGCGKSTLGRLLAGYESPSTGTISCDGGPLPEKCYCPVQMIFQHPELAVDPRWKISKILAEGNPDAGPLLRRFGIPAGWLERYPHELSCGELQRITLIRAMTPVTRYLIADEMTASLDPITQASIWQAVLGWAKAEQVGILVISHDTMLLDRLCDRITDCFQGSELHK